MKFSLREPEIWLLTEEDKFPFGQYEGVKIKDVPLTYLLNLQASTWLEAKNPSLKKYLDEHIQDHIDREWEEEANEEEYKEYYEELGKITRRSKKNEESD